MDQIELKERQTKKAYLDELYYEAAKQDQDFYLTKSRYNKYGEHTWTKWKKYLDAQSDPWFMYNVNHRTILKNEVVIDLDKPTIEENMIEAEKVINQLKNKKYSYWAFKTGSKGVHIHLFFKNLERETPYKRKKFKHYFLERYGGDTQKSNERCMIAIEYAFHWKTGNKKELFDYEPGINNYLGGR